MTPCIVAVDRWLDEHLDDPVPVVVEPPAPRWATVAGWPGVSVCDDGRVDGPRGPLLASRGWVRLGDREGRRTVRVVDLVAAAFGGGVGR
jgi:hypothetical protein